MSKTARTSSSSARGTTRSSRTTTRTCLNANNCQSESISIDAASRVNLFSVTTVATTNSLSIGGSPGIKAAGNVDGFQSTFTSWSSS
ncbi:glycoside hydrolase family 55 protein [Athelia psychrophila]|uniref:Glycoside hydrolase family 55 protein n=1 Tax=Athelia psychrophila TaxID=1759441 RepID=A0A167WDK6_9AGAM|nr:glycoside hydrolase family 55 protein [Fibularhizoctonia sp. CBS 109695]